MSKPRILLADDHVLIRDGIRRLLETDYDIVGEASDGRELVRAAIKLRPDVIVVDIGMPNLNGLEAIRQLEKENLRAKIIFLTMNTGVEFAVQAFRLGASGYLLKVDASDELVRAIQEALGGRLYITPSIARDVMTALLEVQAVAAGDEDPWTSLTGREREVLQLVSEGHKMAEIGEILHISPRTVERHKYKLMDKLKLRTTAELTHYAIRRGITSQS